MNNEKALAARIAALENAVVYLVATIAIYEETPRETSLSFYREVFGLSMKRYSMAQEGPEKEIAALGLDASHTLYQRLRAFLFE
ncbi:hypothetical protein [Hirschia litorea]|uniref:Uncharacterized protein n=1 Tax=Hirschia litorea TaxID=1199156 RepID=A0ABW2IPU9_9PROT